MLKNSQIDPARVRSQKIILISSLILTIVILGLISYVGLLSYQGVRSARQRYYQEAAHLKKKDILVTIIEGWRREQIVQKLIEAGVLSSPEEFLKLTENLEGRLFPDTYRFFPNSQARDVVNKLTDNFQKRTSSLGNLNQAAIILASIVEREAATDSERAAIAGVYQNRLKAGIMLEADPTAQYARDSIKYNWWQPITKDEINSTDSPYNTYKIVGLPPGPIASPGLKSLAAALNPEKHSFYYFFHSADGQIIFSRTLADHNFNKTRYGVKSVD